MDTAQYELMVNRILQNKEWYRKIPESHVNYTTTQYRKLIGSTYHQGLISKKTWEYLNVADPKTPTLYAIPKIHKHALDPPGRPIVSGNGCLTEPASALIGDFLRPFVEGLTSYLQDTRDLLKVLDGMCISENSWLVTLDVEALYNSIPHDLGIGVVEGFLSEAGEAKTNYNQFILKLLSFTLNNNIFIFGRSHYLQVQGVAMGKKCAPSYANLYLGGWERHIFHCEDLFKFFCLIPVWRRYIDDIFFIWTGIEAELFTFMELLKINTYNLKFTMEKSRSSLTFLDIQIYVNPKGEIRSTLFRKPLAANTVLHASSSHPEPLVASIPYGQYLCLKRNCSSEADFELEAKKLQIRLRHRGYSNKCLKRSYLRAKKQTRSSLIHGQKLPKSNEGVRLITRYCAQHSQI
ncbi:uncharacterized protein LOC143964418 [Lithobates pipiens]